MTRIEIKYQYTVGFARRATWKFLRRYGRRGFILAGAAFVIGISRVLMQLNGQLTVSLLLMPLLIPLVWAVTIRRATKLALALRDSHVVVTIDEQGVSFETTEHRSFTAWPSLGEVWMFGDVWLLFPYGSRVGSAYTAIPVKAMTPEFLSVMSQKLSEHGTIVRD